MQSAPSTGPFADPTPMGLIGLAVGCVALLPIAFGAALTPSAFLTASWFCLLFGGGCQLLCGLMSFANRNGPGGTLFAAFAFNWFMNGVVLRGLAQGQLPDHAVLLAVDCAFLVLFVFLTWGFAYLSGFLALFLLDIDLLYACKVVAGISGTGALALPIALLTAALAVLALWLALAMLVNPLVGRRVFPVGGPLLRAPPQR